MCGTERRIACILRFVFYKPCNPGGYLKITDVTEFLKNPRKALSFRSVRYVISGGLSFATENITFLFAFYVLDLTPAVSNVASVLVAVLVNFLVSKYFVFNSGTHAHSSKKQAVLYGMLIIFNLCASTLTIRFLIGRGVAGYLAKPLLAIVIAIWSYACYRKWIFADSNTQK